MFTPVCGERKDICSEVGKIGETGHPRLHRGDRDFFFRYLLKISQGMLSCTDRNMLLAFFFDGAEQHVPATVIDHHHTSPKTGSRRKALYNQYILFLSGQYVI